MRMVQKAESRKRMRLFACAVAAVMLTVPYSSAAQEDKETLPARKTSSHQIGDWNVSCASNKGSKKSCAMAQRLNDAKTKQVVFAWLVGLNAAGDQVITLRTPLGLMLQKGVAVQVDENPKFTVPFRTCIKAFCEAVQGLNKPLVAMLKKGAVAKVQLQNLQEETIWISISLRGFSQAYKIYSTGLKQD